MPYKRGAHTHTHTSTIVAFQVDDSDWKLCGMESGECVLPELSMRFFPQSRANVPILPEIIIHIDSFILVQFYRNGII